jgi:hypothetical protein
LWRQGGFDELHYKGGRLSLDPPVCNIVTRLHEASCHDDPHLSSIDAFIGLHYPALGRDKVDFAKQIQPIFQHALAAMVKKASGRMLFTRRLSRKKWDADTAIVAEDPEERAVSAAHAAGRHKSGCR